MNVGIKITEYVRDMHTLTFVDAVTYRRVVDQTYSGKVLFYDR